MISDFSNGPPCPICEYSRTGFLFSKSGYDIYCCTKCAFKFVHPSPSDPADVYSEEYFRGATHGFGYVDYEEDKVAMRHFFETVLDSIERYKSARPKFFSVNSGPANSMKLLDVGAATGFFVKIAEGRGWNSIGLEISAYAVSAAFRNGAPVIQGTLDSADFHYSSFDAITLLDVIEHVADPVGMVEKCVKLLRPGGILAINTPDSSSLWAKIFGRAWHAYCPPEHLSYFNPDNLSQLLKNHGLEVEGVSKLAKRFSPAYVFSMLFRWQKFRFWMWLSGRIKNTFLNRISLPVNIRDNFFIIARRGR